MNPNDPRIVPQRGEILTWQGRADEGVEWIERAMRLDPFGAAGRAHLLARALYSLRRYTEAIGALRMITSPISMNLAEMAACFAQTGYRARASELTKAVLRTNLDFTVDRYLRNRPYEDPADATHLAEGLRLAGLP